LHRYRYVVPRCCHEIVAEACSWRKADGVQHAINAAKVLACSLADTLHVGGIRDVELGNRW